VVRRPIADIEFGGSAVPGHTIDFSAPAARGAGKNADFLGDFKMKIISHVDFLINL